MVAAESAASFYNVSLVRTCVVMRGARAVCSSESLRPSTLSMSEV